MRWQLAGLLLLAFPGLGQAQVSSAIRAQARVVDASASQATVAAARALDRTGKSSRAMSIGLAMVAAHPAQTVARGRRQVVEISFLRN